VAFVVSAIGITWTAILIALIFSCLVALTEVRYRSKQRWRVCFNWGLLLYATALGLGNVVTTVIATFYVDLSKVDPWSPLLYAFLGVFSFQAILNNVNITYLDQGVLAIKDWTRKARTIAVEAALQEKVQARDELRRRMDENSPRLSEEKLSTLLAQCCGGNTIVNKIKADAKKSGGDAKYYLALELVDRAPDAARIMLDNLDKDQE
jgi:hypothetical protein